jgi:mRNA-degrading endonuclease RelE of RelBE toxin-antitoxin system
MLTIIFSKSKALKQDWKHLKKSGDLERIGQYLQQMAFDPFAFKIKKLEGASEEGVFRIRKGKYRILFDIDYANEIMVIHRIKLRKEGYK